MPVPREQCRGHVAARKMPPPVPEKCARAGRTMDPIRRAYENLGVIHRLLLREATHKVNQTLSGSLSARPLTSTRQPGNIPPPWATFAFKTSGRSSARS
jgi:hypothetical protein